MSRFVSFLLFLLMTFFISVSFAKNIDASQSLLLLEKLSNAPGAPGYEDSVRDILKADWAQSAQQLKVDNLGNLIAKVSSKKNGPNVLIMAHMDEIALWIKYITDDGFIYFDTAGGILNPALIAQRWEIPTKKGPILGYTAIDSPHIMETKSFQLAYDKLFVDIGASNKEEVVSLGIRPGMPMTPATKFAQLEDGRLIGKAFDDRAGLAVLTEVLEQFKNKNTHNNNLMFAATVQEEVGLRGARTVYHMTKPNLVINLEAAIARDYPELVAKKHPQVVLGKGPAVLVYDGTVMPDHNLVDWIAKVAKDNDIPLQYDAEPKHYGEDNFHLQGQSDGVLVVTLGVPVRYAHAASGVMDIQDYQNTVKLVSAIIKSANQQSLKEITGKMG